MKIIQITLILFVIVACFDSEYLKDEGVDRYSLRVEILGQKKTYNLIHTTLSDSSILSSLSTTFKFIIAL